MRLSPVIHGAMNPPAKPTTPMPRSKGSVTLVGVSASCRYDMPTICREKPRSSRRVGSLPGIGRGLLGMKGLADVFRRLNTALTLIRLTMSPMSRAVPFARFPVRERWTGHRTYRAVRPVASARFGIVPGGPRNGRDDPGAVACTRRFGRLPRTGTRWRSKESASRSHCRRVSSARPCDETGVTGESPGVLNACAPRRRAPRSR
jgi:hypothetical protein